MDSQLRQEIIEEAKGFCQSNLKDYLHRGTEIHHILANTKLNRKLYGDRIDRKENLILLCNDCHNKHSLFDKDKRKALRDKWNKEIELESYNNLF
jgi:5-methylcytosine-specific restriction endonuclease McrA